MSLKICTVCKIPKEKTEFYRHGHGLSPRCKECHKAWARDYKKEYRKSHPYQPRRNGFRHTQLSLTAYELWTNAVKRSAHRSLPECTITREWVLQAVTDFCKAQHHSFEPKHPFRPSLDRMVRSEGYTPDNTRVVWLIENLARNSFTDEQLVEFCLRKLELWVQ